ncbi:MAG: hypothetical protein WC840_03340 [Candidatus Peribacteraceae bacterium]
MPPLSPAYDNKIVRKYSDRTIEHKADNKADLQEELHWIAEPKQPIICLPTGITDALGGSLLEEVLPGLLTLPISIVIRGRGSKRFGELFTTLTKEHGHRCAIVPDDELHLRKLLAGSDMAMFFAPQDEGEELENALRYGVVPVSPPRDILENYNPVQESGNAFVFELPTPWQCFGSLVRALETFKFPYDWRTIQRHAMESIDRHSAGRAAT